MLTPENQHNGPLPQKTSETDQFQGKSRDLKYTESEDTPPWFFCCCCCFISVCFPPFFFFLFFFYLFLSFFSSFIFISFFLFSLFLLFPKKLAFGHSAVSKMTRRKSSPQKKESETVLSPRVTNLDYNSMPESQFRSTIIKLLVTLKKA